MLKLAAGCCLLFLLNGCASAEASPEPARATHSEAMQVVPLKHAAAAEIAAELGRVLEHARLVADQRTNSLVISAETDAHLAQALELVEDLDVDVTEPR
jgi:hypothetical protein